MAASSSPARRVIVVGSVNVDLVVNVPTLPGPGETVIGGRFSRHHGGKGGNQAVATARLGVETAFVGAVGSDAFGRDARAALESERIDLRGLVVVDDEATGVALIVVDEDGENSIAVAGGANARLTVEHLRAALERLAAGPADVVLVGHEIPTAVTREALRLGRAAGAVTILNPAPAGDLGPDVLELADVLTPNRGELLALVGHAGRMGSPAGAVDSAGATAPAEPVRPVAEGLLDGSTDRAILVSLGADGALLVRADGTTVLPAPTVQAVDTVGAGDTLNGALAAGLATGLDLLEASRQAVAAAALAVTRSGAREGMPTAAELEAFTADAAPSVRPG